MNERIEIITGAVGLVLPASFLLLAGCALLGIGAFLRPSGNAARSSQRGLWATVMLGLLACAWMLALVRGDGAEPVARGLFRLDDTTVSCEWLMLLGGTILVLIGWSSAPERALPEYYGCFAILLSGLAFVGSANDLASLFLALELVSIPTYVLLSICRRDNPGREAALKYFTLSSFSSCFFLLGISYLYGVTGSTDLEAVAQTLASRPSLLGSVAIVLVLCGLAFRVTAVPFHFYASDVFAGTSLTMAAMLSYLPKIAGFVAILRMSGGLSVGSVGSPPLVLSLSVLAAVTMSVGNALALVQSDLRRLLAYSSVAHSGYLLVGVAAMASAGVSPSPVFGYLAVYAAMTLGAFAIVQGVESSGPAVQKIDDLGGLVYRSPAAAFALIVCLVSLIGLPMTAGFWAKLQIFFSAIAAADPQMRFLAVVMAVNAAISAAYYLRVAGVLFRPMDRTPMSQPWPSSLVSASAVCCVLTLIWFFRPV